LTYQSPKGKVVSATNTSVVTREAETLQGFCHSVWAEVAERLKQASRVREASDLIIMNNVLSLATQLWEGTYPGRKKPCRNKGVAVQIIYKQIKGEGANAKATTTQ